MKIRDILMKINESELDGAFSDLYGKAPAVLTMQKDRYIRALEEFGKVFPEVTEKDPDISVFSAPGRSPKARRHISSLCSTEGVFSAMALCGAMQSGMMRSRSGARSDSTVPTAAI